jgi:hypothetical protein
MDTKTFTATGTIDQNTAPISTTADSATYNLPADLQITLGLLNFTGYSPTLTLIDPPSGPDTMSLNFTVIEAGFKPDVNATLSLPEGTLNGAGLQTFWVNVSQPDSSFSFSLPIGEVLYAGTLGITGTASITGETPPPSGVPEPATMGLLAAGLLAVGFTKRGLRSTRP